MTYEIYIYGLEHTEIRREDFRRVGLRKKRVKSKDGEKLSVNFSLSVAKGF